MPDIHDLPAEERGDFYELVERRTGQDFHDLPPEERADWVNRIEDDPRGWYGSEWDY